MSASELLSEESVKLIGTWPSIALSVVLVCLLWFFNRKPKKDAKDYHHLQMITLAYLSTRGVAQMIPSQPKKSTNPVKCNDQ
jgi:hypothetical protein